MAEPDPSLTPEQKLLKIIEQQPNAQSGAPAASGEKKAPAPAAKKGFQISDLASFFSPSGIKGRIAYLQERFQKLGKEPVNVKQVNKIVSMIALGFSAYLAVALGYEISVSHRDYELEFKISPTEVADAPVSTGKRVDPNLFEEIEKRNIFTPTSKRVAEQPAEESQPASLKLVEIIKDLKLAGISINEEEPSKSFCMVEDIKKNVTNFLKVGDTVSGLKVDQINSYGIVLKYQQESIELR